MGDVLILLGILVSEGYFDFFLLCILFINNVDDCVWSQ